MRPASPSIALALLALALPVRSEARQVSHHVLVVAHNQSLDRGVRPLRFADDDGARFFELYSEAAADVSLLAVLDPDTARVHPEAARAARVPWRRNLRGEVGRIAARVRRDNRAGKRTVFTFIYVGHGNVGKDGEGYVNLQDARLRRQELFRDVVDRIPAGTVHLIIDACKSFFLVSRGPGDWRDDRSGRTYREEVRAFLSHATLEAHPHVGAILSTSGDEEVHEWSAFRSGVFSHQLRSALSGAADINGDGRIEYSEVGAFIASANRRVVHQRARLRPFVRPPPADLHAPLYDTAGGQSGRLRLELGAALRGRVSIEDERGVRILDMNKAAGALTRIALSPDHKYFVRHRGQESILPRRSHGLMALGGLERGPASSSPPRGSVDQAFRNDMFAVPLTRSFYEGYLAMTDIPGVSFSSAEVEREVELPTGGIHPWTLDTAYLLSPPALAVYGGVQHTATVGVRRDIAGPLYVAARAELGLSRHGLDGDGAGELSLIRAGLLLGAGVRWRLRGGQLELAAEADAGYQALVTTVKDELDPSSAKLGAQLLVTVRPFRGPRLRRLGIVLRGGYFGHVLTVTENGETGEQVRGLPEGGVGLSWGF
jgi:hypothetical protein